MKRAMLLAAILAAASQASAANDVRQRLDRVKALSDGVLSIGKAGPVMDDATGGKDPLWMWRAMEEGSDNASTGGFVRIDFTLKPEAESVIRCRAELPLPEKWNGTFWGRGNSGYAGSIPRLRGFAAEGDAVVTADLGTSMLTGGGKHPPYRWTAAAQRDFDWRATHLMTTYGKRIAEAFYGKKPRRSYFNGGSTGGRQALSEAIRFPSDYDGIIAHLPDSAAMSVEIASWHLYRQTHDGEGRLLFTTNEMRVVADAAVESRRGTDPEPYAGVALADSRLSGKDVDGMLAIAAGRCPSLSNGDKLERMKAIHGPLFIGGKCVFTGFAPGSYLAPRMNGMGIVYLRAYLLAKGFDERKWGQVGEREIIGFMRECSPTFNACASDLSAFRRRGGKLIMTAGWEDQTIPPGLIVDHYERVIEADGGLDRTLSYFRLFCIPGCAHGGGKGRIITGSPGGKVLRRILADWVENGKAPESIPCGWAAAGTTIPVAPYPGLSVRKNGSWRTVQTQRGVASRLGDDVCKTVVSPLEGETPSAATKPVSVLYLGDSLSDFDRGSNHVDKLQAKLDGKWPGKFQIHNFSVRGDFIERVMDRMNAKEVPGLHRYKGIWDRHYDWAFVFLGHNDTRTRKDTGFTVPHMSDAQVRDGFTALIALLKSKGISRIILLSSASSNFEGIRRRTALRIAAIKAGKGKDTPFAQFGDPKLLEAYNSIMSEMASNDPAVEYLDIYTPMKARPDKASLFRPDGVHLSPMGQDYVADAEFAYIDK